MILVLLLEAQPGPCSNLRTMSSNLWKVPARTRNNLGISYCGAREQATSSKVLRTPNFQLVPPPPPPPSKSGQDGRDTRQESQGGFAGMVRREIKRDSSHETLSGACSAAASHPGYSAFLILRCSAMSAQPEGLLVSAKKQLQGVQGAPAGAFPPAYNQMRQACFCCF